tara:strand:- start:1157 stop:1807 length:651 start_codon:yes stop_codon:yes gene_type:complete
MKVSLNKKQLKHISNLIEMKGVNYYDVNMEMTDHIASEVEELIANNNLEYMKAIKQTFLRYDRFHFMNIEEEKKKKVMQQARREFYRGLLQFFTIPKIIATLAIFMISYTLLNFFGFEYLLIFLAIISLPMSIYLYKKKKGVVGNKDFLQIKAFNSHGFLVLFLPFQAFNIQRIFIDKLQANLYFQSFFITIILISMLVVFTIYNSRLDFLKTKFI